MNNNLIRLDDLPEDLQQKIREHQEEQHQIEIYKKQLQETREIEKQNPGTNIIINNHNTYNITNNTRILKNEGTINEKQEGILDMLARGAGAAAKGIGKWLNERSE